MVTIELDNMIAYESFVPETPFLGAVGILEEMIKDFNAGNSGPQKA